MWTSFKVFIEFAAILLLFYVLGFWLQGMWDLSFPTRDRTHNPCIGRQSLNHWTAREVPAWLLLLCSSHNILIIIIDITRTIIPSSSLSLIDSFPQTGHSSEFMTVLSHFTPMYALWGQDHFNFHWEAEQPGDLAAGDPGSETIPELQCWSNESQGFPWHHIKLPRAEATYLSQSISLLADTGQYLSWDLTSSQT